MRRASASGLSGEHGAGARRYPGTRSFADDELDRSLFRGRDRERRELLHLILAERLSLLFARSGMGKTSLIQAGLMDPLRRRDYWPVVARVNDTQHGPFHTLYHSLERSAAERGVEYVAGDQTTLWHFFKTVELWRGDVLLTPVLIIDQFEELFTLQRPEPRQRFVDQLADVVRGTRPASAPAETDGLAALSDHPPNVKVVLSLREDFLAHLEELAGRIPGILKNRYRLGPLRRETAESAVVEPARLAGDAFATRPFSWSPPAVEQLLDFLCRRKNGGSEPEDEVEPFQLQLLCRHLEGVVATRQAAGGADVEIQPGDLGSEDDLRNVLSSFYEETLAGARERFTANRRWLTRRRAGRRLEARLQKLSEYGLITDEGRRLSVEESDIRRRFQVDPEVLDELVDRRLLRREPRIGSRYYELTHDTLVDPILQSRQRRERRKRARRRTAGALAGVILAVVLLVFMSALMSAQLELREASRELIRTKDQLEKEEQRAQRLAPAALKGLGRKAGDPDLRGTSIDLGAVEEGLRARQLAEDLAARIPQSQRREIVIWYFPKLADEVDLGVVLSTLEGYGFRLTERPPKNDLRTNAMWVAGSVSVEEAKMIALTLVAAGVEIRRVGRIPDDSGYTWVAGRLVQVGASRYVRNYPPLSVADVESAGEFPWSGSRP